MTTPGQEIGFIEEFALAKDRTVPLGQLIPGTEEFYYFHCLHYQNTQQFDKADEMLAAWVKRHPDSSLWKQMRYRQALLTYDRNPENTLAFLKSELGLTFSHQRDRLDEMPQVPSILDNNLLDRRRQTDRALTLPNLDGFEDSALRWLIGQELDADRRRVLLSRLQRPDCDNLPRIIAADLQHRNSGGFGSLAIHSLLLRDQLDELLKLRPQLRNETSFVNTYIARLAASDDVDLLQNTDAYKAWLTRLHEFISTLDPSHNSLKAHVLHHRLVLDQQTGERSRERFLEYIRLPRRAPYVNEKWLNSGTVSRELCDLGQDFGSVTSLRAVGSDDLLVRDYLLNFFVKDTGYKDFEPYLNDVYLKHLFAEAKIVNGLGDGEQWYSLLPPDQYQQLKERVDIDFAATNRRYYAPGEAVALDVHVKNVPNLIVKVFEINTLNFHRDNLRDVNTNINLDGLVANDEHTWQYADPPLRRVARRFEFPELNQRGTYVIDFIGNGRSSRALIRRGQLRFVEQSTPAGHAFTVLDETDAVLKDARLFLGGQQFDAAEDGRIVVPFTTEPGPRKFVIAAADDFSSIGEFEHRSESYELAARMHVDRESLLRQRKAQLLVRPQLTVNGIPTSLKLLSNVKLTIASVDHDGTKSLQEIPGLELFEDRESIHEFAVPPRLASLTFSLSATVKQMTTNKDLPLASAHSVTVNRIDTTEKISDVHLLRSDGQFVVEMRGMSGELRPARPLHVTLKHRDFRQMIQQTLATDDNGQIRLGTLDGIDSISISGEGIQDRQWNLLQDQHDYDTVIHARAGEEIRVPWMTGGEPDRAHVSLLELRRGAFVADRFSNVRVRNGFLVISELQPGDYHLLLRPHHNGTLIRVTAGRAEGNVLLGENRQLEIRGRNPIQIESVTSNGESVTIRLQNVSKFARVHLFATRYVPEFSAFQELLTQDAPPFAKMSPRRPLSTSIEGRNIGDEYRYILERRSSTRFPGNMNERPGMLLNPFVLRSTETEHQVAAAGGDFAPASEAPSASMMEADADGGVAGDTGGFANLDFLPSASMVAFNLIPGDDGIITIAIDRLGDHQHLHVVAVDALHTASRTHSLKAPEPTRLDLRLAASLDPAKHFNQSRDFRLLGQGEQLTTDETASVRLEVIDSLARVYQLYSTLNGSTHLTEFEFVIRWPALEAKEKQTLYSKYACHELNFFIARKDPEFFEQIVLPFLSNKMHKTFMDRCLLGEDLRDYLQPWAHSRLNVVEQILLAERIDGEFDRTSRFINEAADMVPVDINRATMLFDTAFSSLDLAESLGEAPIAISDSDAAAERHLGRGAVARFGAPSAVGGGFGFGGLAGAAAPGAAGDQLNRDGAVDARGRLGWMTESDFATGVGDRELKELADARRLSEDLWEKRRSAGSSEAGAKAEAFFEDTTLLLRLSDEQKQLYRRLAATQEWVENNYYRLPIEQQLAGLVTVNEFWRDFASRDRDKPFVSDHVLEASHNFTEMMLAMAVLDLPFTAPEHLTEVKDGIATFTAAGPTIAALDEIRPADAAEEASPILVSQDFYQHNDRYRHVGAQKLDRFLTDEFIVNTVYGCQIAVTNPTSAPKTLTLVLQIPAGALPVLNSHYTRRVAVSLNPFTTQTHDYHFYFPAAGSFTHYPVQITDAGQVVAFADPMTFHVVEKPTTIDRESWDYVSQFASTDQVIEFLKNRNLQRVDLARIAWRMKDAEFFAAVTRLLHERHLFNDTLWAYAIHHNVPDRIRQFLAGRDNFVTQLGPQIVSPLLTVNPVDRHTWQHRDYSPLVNARAHRLGAARTILNDRFREQYQSLMQVLAYQPSFDDEQELSITYYLLLQDRVEEAQAMFAAVNPENIAAEIQYDYCAAYLDFFDDDPAVARTICDRYSDFPVDRWRNLFAAMKSQIDELDGAEPKTIDPEKTEQRHNLLAASDCSFDLEVENRQVAIDFQNVETLTVNYYLMDIELLFSRNPFVQQYGNRFSSIRPNLTSTVELPADKASITFELPADLHNSNVLVEVVGRGMKKAAAYYSNSLSLNVIENYGQVSVTDATTGKGLPRAYVKTYARMKDGAVRFYKDGYTDLRGRFDYASLNTGELDNVDRFSLLVLSESHGATVQEAAPPQR